MDVEAEQPGQANPHANAFFARSTPLRTETEARDHLDVATARTWKVTNPNVRNRLGEPVGYKFFPGDNAVPYAGKDAWWRKRAGFVDHHVWVTPFADGENFAAGDYPNQSHGGDGLPKWTDADRPIENTDLVFWYTFGHTHIPRPEDYPVMPTAYIGFLLKPNGFFRQNPANDVPPAAARVGAAAPAADGGCCH